VVIGLGISGTVYGIGPGRSRAVIG